MKRNKTIKKTRGLKMSGNQVIARIIANCRHSFCEAGVGNSGLVPVFCCELRKVDQPGGVQCVHMRNQTGLCKDYDDYQDPAYRKDGKEELTD